MFCASDIGWVVGHSYIVYAPLLAGATTILFEGKPIGTPNAGSFRRIIQEHKVTTLFTAPTALRAIRKDDPQGRYLKEMGEKGGLRTWRALFLAGERSEPSIITLYQDFLTTYAAKDAIVVDNWWSSESGSPITGIALRPELGLPSANQHQQQLQKRLKIKPGSAGKPLPGFSVNVIDDSGRPVGNGKMGNLVLGIPLAPTAFTTLFNDEMRFYKGYMKRFDGKWIDTGDAGMIDEEGYVHVMSRSDDVINVAAHRFSTGMSDLFSPFPSISLKSSTPHTDKRLHHPRRLRTISPIAPLDPRMLCNSLSRPTKRFITICIHHHEIFFFFLRPTKSPTKPTSNSPTHSPKRTQHPPKKSDRSHRFPRRYHSRNRNHSQDSIRKDFETCASSFG